MIFAFHCAEYEHHNPVHTNERTDAELLTGYVQKGPFTQGASVLVASLNERFEIFDRDSGVVMDNTGYFELPRDEAALVHRIVAQGYSYHEVLGTMTETPLTLRAIVTQNMKAGNVNVLTTLAHDRIQKLVLEDGLAITDAVCRAETEVMSLFGIQDASVSGFCTMNIARSGNRNGALLAASLLVLGDTTAQAAMQLMTALSSDLKGDGIVNDSILVRRLVRHAERLHPAEIRQHLGSYYENLNMTYIIAPFELYAMRLLPFHVISVLPGPGESDQAVESVILMDFNKAVHPAMSGPGWVSVSGPDQEITGSLLIENGSRLVFVPGAPLPYETDITVLLGPGFMAEDSTALGIPYSWTFASQKAPLPPGLPDALSFGEPYGAGSLTISNSGGDTLFWELTSTRSWLQPDPAQGWCTDMSTQVLVSVDTSGLEPGTHAGSLYLKSNGGDDSVAVTLVIPAYPEISLSGPDTLDFGIRDSSRSLEIRNSGTGILVWQTEPDAEWLSVDPPNGQTGRTAESIQVTIDRNLMSGGYYAGHIVFTSNGGNDTLTVFAEAPYKLEIRPDASESRDASVCSLPCTISQTIMNSPCQDSNLDSLTVLRLESWTYSGYQGHYRSFLGFDLSMLDADAVVDSAVLALYFPDEPEAGHAGDNGYIVHRVIADWNAATVTWANQPAVAGGMSATDRVVVPESVSETQDYRIDVTDMVRFWQAGPAQNFGMRLSLNNETFYRRVSVASSDAADENRRPKLTVYYRETVP
ncbi:DNRLRE domain-containing protein [bacterium]|nr:DNRLRE domain-containing protein [bacterium]